MHCSAETLTARVGLCRHTSWYSHETTAAPPARSQYRSSSMASSRLSAVKACSRRSPVDRLRIANTRNAQENNLRCSVLRHACNRSRRAQTLYDHVVGCWDGGASPHVLVQVIQHGGQDLLGRIRLSQARIRDRLRNPGGTEQGNQHLFCPKGQDYPKTNWKSNVFSSRIHILMRHLGVEVKHAFQQSFHLLPVRPVRVAKKRKEARDKRLFINGFWRQLTWQLASFARRLLHPGKPPFGRRGVPGMQPIQPGLPE